MGVLAALGADRRRTSAAPSPRNSASYTSTISAPERRGGGDHRDPGVRPAAGGHEVLQDRAPAQLVLGAADDHEGSPGHDREARGSHSGECRSPARAAPRGSDAARRHASRQGGAAAPATERALTDRGRATPPGPAAGWPRGHRARPRPGLRRGPHPADLGGRSPRAPAGTWRATSTEALRRRPRLRPGPDARGRRTGQTLVVVGHNPTMASLAQLLDDGEGDEEAGDGCTRGLPGRALAVFDVDGRLGRPRRGDGALWPSTGARG